jgi:hypothetical protein
MSNRIMRRFIYIWSGSNFPYVNVLSVVSTLKSHPNAQIIVYFVGETPKSEWSELLENIPQVSIVHTSPDEIFAQLPEHLEKVAEVFHALSPNALSAQSNILRYALLYPFGGVYLDFDVLVLRPLDELLNCEAFVGEELVWADNESRLHGQTNIYLAPRNILWAVTHCLMWLDSHVTKGRLRIAELLQPTFRHWSRNKCNNAVIGASQRSEFIEELLLGVFTASTTIRYATGPTLIDKVVCRQSSNVDRRPSTDFYAVPPGQSYRLFHDRYLSLPQSAFLIHYVASNHPRFVSDCEPLQDAEYDKDTVIGSILNELSQEIHTLVSPHQKIKVHA